MATNSLSRMAYRKDQILQLPFPKTPSLSDSIPNGVLKKEGAVQYDDAMRDYSESVQNILKLAIQWPKFDDLKKQFDSLAATVSGLSTAQGSIAGVQAALAILSTQVSLQQITINNLNNSVINLLSAVNGNAIPMLVLTVSGLTPNAPLIPGIMGIFGAQRAFNNIDGGFWTWNGNDWSPG